MHAFYHKVLMTFNDALDHNMICLFAQTWIKLVDVAFEV